MGILVTPGYGQQGLGLLGDRGTKWGQEVQAESRDSQVQKTNLRLESKTKPEDQAESRVREQAQF